MQPGLPTKRLYFRRLRSQCRRWVIPSLMFLAALPVYAQTGASPWENAVTALKTSFTGPIAQGLALVVAPRWQFQSCAGPGNGSR